MKSDRSWVQRRVALATVAAAQAVVAVAAVAQPPAGGEEPTTYVFGEIVVRGEEPRVVEEVTTVEVVTAEEIERSGARTVAEAIALLPGLHVRSGAEGVPLVDVRGLRTRNVLLLLDGVPLNSSFDGLFDPAALSVEGIARIELTRGGSSVLYGPGGTGGVLEIVTRGTAEGGDAWLRAEQGFADSSGLRGRASVRRGAVGLVVAGSVEDRDSTRLASDFTPTRLEDGGRRLNSDRSGGSALASLTFDAAPGTRLGLNLNLRSVERGKPPVTEDAALSDFAPVARFERAEQDSLSLHAALSHEVGPRLTLRPTLYLNRAEELTRGFDDDTFSTQRAAGALREDATTRVVGAGLQVAFQRGRRGLATVALDLRQEAWRANGFTMVGPRGGGGGGGRGGGRGGGGGGGGAAVAAAFDDDRSVQVASLALEYELAPGGPFSAVLGAGYAAQSRPGAATDDDVHLLVGGRYALGARSALRASVARQIRFPTLRDLYGADRGNPQLSAERTVGYEVAVERALGAGGQFLELALFRVDADDFIQRTPGEALRNSEETRFQGVEVQGRHLLARETRLTWSYSHLVAENRSPGATVRETQNRPGHKAAVVAEREMARGLRLRGEVLWVADSYALSRTQPTRTVKLGDYAVADFILSRSLRGDRLRVTARLANLLDEDYADSIGFPAPGRTLLVALELRAP